MAKKKITIEVDFEVGDTVYLTTDVQQLKRIVTQLHVDQDGITYSLQCGSEYHRAFAIEMSSEKDANITLYN